MKKRNIIIIIVILLIIIGLLLIIFGGKHESKLFSSIIKKIDNKDSFIIYFTDNDPSENGYCADCRLALKYIEYNKDKFNLDVVVFDKYSYSDEEYTNIFKKLKLEKELKTGNVIFPFIIYIVDGKWRTLQPMSIYEGDFRYYLKEYKYITEEEYNEEIIINSKEDYDKVLKDNTNSVIYLYSHNQENAKYRKKLIELSKKYKFKYYLIYIGFGNTGEVDMAIEKQYKGYGTPSLLVVGNNKYIDFKSITKDSDIDSFISKNYK